ncbi:phage holin family protein [Chitinasiproducens palmae]|uniref:Uncharacterized membrane protein YqjE n=1 Tax=Chitinasiproducens palmae TaxID=1770053 RepID=A0A1H2PSW9_9BURK|nr:phage holin family protein [Chitinasiproducens palmae]SDV50144.1 Uncharacterized membrane protein YqjE [Chitinasiproducens palmae]
MSSGNPPGPIDSISRLAQSFSALVQTRLEIFSIELAEEKDRLLRSILAGLTALLFAGATLIAFTALIVVLCWDSYRWQSIAVLTVLYALITVWLGLSVRNGIRQAPRAFDATIREFENDRDAFTRGPR